MYHVTLRGNHRQDIFFCATDRVRMSELFADVLTGCNARLHAYCYMPNHVHALIQVSDVALGRLMLRVAGPYARITQARMPTTGHLFEKRYYPVLVDTDTYLLELLRYIHLNPVRAGLVRDPASYRWSSHHAYVGDDADSWVTTDFALSMFDSQRGRAVDAYQRFVADALRTGVLRSPLENCNSNDPRILGSDEFASRLLGPGWRPRSRKSLQQLIEEACAQFALTEDELKSSSRLRRVVAARAWVAKEAVVGRVASLSHVARAFRRNESSLRRACRKREPPNNAELPSRHRLRH